MELLIFIIFFTPTIAQYDDKIRYTYMPFAAAAYSDDPNQCWLNWLQYMKNENITYTIYRKYNVRCDSFNDTCSAYIALRSYINYKDVSAVYIAFRGTNNNYAFFENGWNYDDMVPFVSGGSVGKIFFDGFNDIWNAGMKDDLLTLKNKYPNAKFYFTGHSLGGALVSLAAAKFAEMDKKLIVELYTFGQPRIGDKSFAISYVFNAVPMAYRIIHRADIVPHLPPLNETVYYHYIQEYWYNNDMGVNDYSHVCSNGDGEYPTCSNSLNASDYNMDDHKYYFGRDFIEYGKNGCPDLATSRRSNL